MQLITQTQYLGDDDVIVMKVMLVSGTSAMMTMFMTMISMAMMRVIMSTMIMLKLW